MELNSKQTPLEELHIEDKPQEVQEQFWDCLNNIPYIRSLIAQDRPRACDLPRDESGKIIVDLTNPHILEDTDYFRPSAIHYQKYGNYTDLTPNANPNSEFGKWIRTEIRRCYEGMVRPSDGEWITGDMYFFLNYCPILLIKKDAKGKSNRTIDFPLFWEGNYYRFHYLYQCREHGRHAIELSKRGSGKSYSGAALLAKRFILGESPEVNKKVQSVVTASEKKYIQGANQILDMFQFYIDFCAANTQFPYKRLTSSLQNMQWTMGYTDIDTNTRRGTENSVMGITSKDDESKLRGSRGVLYLLEEAGSFPRLGNLYQVLRPSVEDGNSVWGLIYCYGTAGDSNSDFKSMQEMMYNPEGYNVYPIKNIYDIEGQGKSQFTYFFPGYINRAECYDKDGNSDVTKALMEILEDRFKVKYNTTDINAITKRIAEIPITPQEAIMKTRGNMFPVTQLNERLNEIDSNPNIYDDVYTGTLVLTKNGNVEFRPTADTPIRDYPLKDNRAAGAIEIYTLPERDAFGHIPSGRYIIGHDPVDADVAESVSLTSTFVLDLFTDKIVAEYTGRLDFAEDNFERVRLLCLFYNAKCLYENNWKGLFAYFSRLNCTHLLADTPEYLRDKQLIKQRGWGNQAKGVSATQAINNYANELIRDWLIKPVPYINEEGTEVVVPNLMFIKSRGLLKELIAFNPIINVDRVRALGMAMLYREEKMILYQGDMSKAKETSKGDEAENDDFFKINYDDRFTGN